MVLGSHSISQLVLMSCIEFGGTRILMLWPFTGSRAFLKLVTMEVQVSRNRFLEHTFTVV